MSICLRPPNRAPRCALLACTALAPATIGALTAALPLAAVLALLTPAPVFAQSTGGAGGGTGGGDGGDAGAAGADGTGPTPGTGGSAGTLVVPNGGSGQPGATDIGGGGGGGGGGFSFTFSGDVAATVTGGNGGHGGKSGENSGGGGGGGGGDGARISTVASVTVSAGVTGGAGGAGGDGDLVDGGGGGGGGAGVVLQQAGGLTVNATVTGGNGGNGGTGLAPFGGGGGGGAGVILEQGGAFTVNAAVTGGDGGLGESDMGGSGGGGAIANASADVTVSATGTITGGQGEQVGGGGAGLTLSAGGTIHNSGTIQGGNGGGLGTSGISGSAGGTGSGGAPGFVPNTGQVGDGGAGIVGAGLTIVNSGTIAGGTGFSGRANAITFTGGANTITFGNATSGLTGDIAVTGSLTFDQSTLDTTVSNVISGTGSVKKTGTATVTLSGVNTYTGGTTFSGGTVSVAAASGLGTGALVFDGGGLLATAGFLLDRTISVNAGKSGTIAAATGTLTLHGQFTTGTGSALHFGIATTGAGEVSLDPTGTSNGLSGVNYYIDAGTVRLNFASQQFFSGNATQLHIDTGATLNINGQSNILVQNLQDGPNGGGIVTNGVNAARTIELENTLDTTFSGVIENGANPNGIAVNKVGNGTLTLSGTNTFSGGITLTQGTISVGSDANLGAASGVLHMDSGTLRITGTSFTSTARTIDWMSGGGGFDIVDAANTFTVSQVLGAHNNTLTKLGAGTLLLTGNNGLDGLTALEAGTLAVGHNNALGTSTLQVDGGTLDIRDGIAIANTTDLQANLAINVGTGATGTHSGTIGETGGSFGITKTGDGTLILSGTNTYTGGTAISAGVLRADQSAALGTGAVTFTGTSATLLLNNADLANAIVLGSGVKGTIDLIGPAALDGAATLGANSILVLNPSNGGLNNTFFLANTSATVDPTALVDIQGGVAPATAGGAALLAANVNIGAAGRLDLNTQNVAIAALTGAGTVTSTNSSRTLTVGSGTFSGSMTQSGAGVLSLVKSGTGTLTLSGTNTYTGATTVNGGTLSIATGGKIVSDTTVNSGGIFNVNGTAAGVIINAGGTLSGNGTIGNTTFNGGALAPGNSIGTISINGNLVLSSATTYMVEVSPTAADRTNVTGTATLGGASVQATFAPGSYVSRSYTILSATGGRNGTFGTLTTPGLPAGFTAALSYTGTDANLDLTAFLGSTGGFSINQLNVANSLNTFFNNGGALPGAFASVYGLTGTSLGNALSQLSGEPATGIQQAGFQATDLFLNAMLDPFVMGGRSGGGFGGAMGGGAIGYAPQSRVASAASEAFASINKAPPQPTTIDQRWGTWGAAYGGYNDLDGDPVVGSHDSLTRTGGFAGGADYRMSPDTVLGAALAMGETNWGLSALGGGRSEHAQLGLYASTRWDAAYLSAAFAAGWHRASTTRTVSIGLVEQLRGNFDASTLGGRIETGYRYGNAAYGVTPYTALQVEHVSADGYAEGSTSNIFALRYAKQSGNDTRSELGAWLDTRSTLANGAAVIWRGRAAWVHEFDSTRDVLATFQTLPGASFTVTGAAPAHNAALASAAAELRLADGLSFIAKLDGQFADGARTYAGTATLRKVW